MWEHGGSRCLVALAFALAFAGNLHAQSPPSSGADDGDKTVSIDDPATVGQPANVDNPLQLPDLTRVLPTAQTREQVSATLKIFILMTVLTLAPAILMMTTSFARIMIVLSLLRQAIGTQQLPPSQILVGISLFLTFMIMGPTYEKIYDQAVVPWLDNAPGMSQAKAIQIADKHMRDFMFAQIERVEGEEEIYMFLEYGRKRSIPSDETILRADVPTTALIPAFILSEIKTAFVMGFRIYLPFLVIDMVIASVLISMGMLMLPPVLISLPFKLLLFVLADGWHLVVTSLLASYS